MAYNQRSTDKAETIYQRVKLVRPTDRQTDERKALNSYKFIILTKLI